MFLKASVKREIIQFQDIFDAFYTFSSIEEPWSPTPCNVSKALEAMPRFIPHAFLSR